METVVILLEGTKHFYGKHLQDSKIGDNFYRFFTRLSYT